MFKNTTYCKNPYYTGFIQNRLITHFLTYIYMNNNESTQV